MDPTSWASKNTDLSRYIGATILSVSAEKMGGKTTDISPYTDLVEATAVAEESDLTPGADVGFLLRPVRSHYNFIRLHTIQYKTEQDRKMKAAKMKAAPCCFRFLILFFMNSFD